MPARGPDGPRIDGALVLLAVIALVAAAYTSMAFGLEWETRAGRIGPGFFPRIIGSLTVALCLLGIVRRARARRSGAATASRVARASSWRRWPSSPCTSRCSNRWARSSRRR